MKKKDYYARNSKTISTKEFSLKIIMEDSVKECCTLLFTAFSGIEIENDTCGIVEHYSQTLFKIYLNPSVFPSFTDAFHTSNKSSQVPQDVSSHFVYFSASYFILHVHNFV